MMQFNIKKLPRGFTYIVPQHQIRLTIKQYEHLFTSIDYDGISMSEQNVSKSETKRSSRTFHLGILYSMYDENIDRWKFRIKLNGIRESNLPINQEEIAAKLLADIELRVSQTIVLPPTAKRNIGDLFLGFRTNNEKQAALYSSFVAT